MTVALRLVVLLAAATLIRGSAAAQLGLGHRLSLERRIEELTQPDARVREDAARALACIGPSARVAPALASALVAEAVPEARAALVVALARRGEAAAVPALLEVWDRATPTEREHVLDGLAAIGTAEALAFVVERLGSELHGPGACARLGRRGDAGIDLVAAGLASSERRDGAALCLAQLGAHERAAAALVAIAPMLAPTTSARALEALIDDPRAIPLAVDAVSSSDEALARAALAVLARHAPDRLPVDRWRALASETDGRGASAIVALLTLDPPFADRAIASVAAQGGARATLVLVGLGSDPSVPASALAPFVALEATRTLALDRLAALPGGAAVLSGLGPLPDVGVALAIAAAADPAALAPLRAYADEVDPPTRQWLFSLAGVLDAGGCARGESIEERRAWAYCLSRARDGGRPSALALETEREPSVVAWLALGAAEPPSEPALHALLALERNRIAILALVPAAIARAAPPERRRLVSTLVASARRASPGERAVAIRALGVLGDERHRAVVALALEDDAPSVRAAAARALAMLPADPVTEIRRLGRARVEHDEDVRAALDGTAIETADAPLRLRVDVRGDGPRATDVEVALADGRVLVLAPIGLEIVLFGVPDRTARVRLLDPERD